jgi:hypothetical protein
MSLLRVLNRETTMAIDECGYVSCYAAPICQGSVTERVHELETAKRNLEKELADLKAAEAAKPKTRGEEIAEYVIGDCSQYYGTPALMLSGTNCGYVLSPVDKPNLNAGTAKIISEARRGLSERIDRAIADERERVIEAYREYAAKTGYYGPQVDRDVAYLRSLK